MTAPLPFPSHYARIGGFDLHYLDEGQGEPVLMVHGNPSWCFYYRNLIERLRPKFRCLAPDHIGMGLSAKPHDRDYPYTMVRRVADLSEFIDQLGVERLTLVAHDWGGMIGLSWAVHHPERVRRLVLLNTAGFRLPEGRRLPWQLRLARTPLVGDLLIRGGNAFARGAARIGCTRHPMTRELRDRYCEPYDSWDHRRAVLRFVQDIPLQPWHRAYAQVCNTEQGLSALRDVPTLILWGDRDPVFDDAFLARWRELLPAAEVRRYADAGHYLLEDAAEDVLPAIEEFLDRTA